MLLAAAGLGTIGIGDALGIGTVVITVVLAYFGIKSKLDKGLLGLQSALEENTRAVNQVSYYIEWLAEKETGTKPPPKLGGEG